MRQSGGSICHFGRGVSHRTCVRETIMRAGVSLQTRREILQHMIPQYREASSVKRKSKLLDTFTAATGYHRKYAMGPLNHAQEVQPIPQRPVLAITGQTSSTRCSWSGTPPTASAPNASCLFSPRSLRRWNGMSTSRSQRSAENNCFP